MLYFCAHTTLDNVDAVEFDDTQAVTTAVLSTAIDDSSARTPVEQKEKSAEVTTDPGIGKRAILRCKLLLVG